MQSGTSTSIHHTQAATLNIHQHQLSSCNADIQDSNAAGRPFSFVPKRRSSSGNMAGKALSGDNIASSSLQQGQIWLVEQPSSDDSATPQTTPHTYSTFPRTRPELPRGRVPEFDGKVNGTTLAIETDTEVDTAGLPAPSTPVPAGPISALLIRKKSGELVKPSLKSTGFATWAMSSPGRARTKSAPTTPTGSKSVHFDAQLEHVKLFLAEQKPLAVSRDGSPTETSEGDTTDTGFPFPRITNTTLRLKGIVMPYPPPEPWTFDVRLENIALEDMTLVGKVLVRNVAFTKWVAIRFTLDAWQTTSEVAARHIASLHDNSFDRFEFRVRLVDYMNGIEYKRVLLCIRFSVEGREMWDSNGGRNYEFGFERVKEDTMRQVHVPTASESKTGPFLMADLRKQLEKAAQDVQACGGVSLPATTVHRKQPRGLRVWLGDRFSGDEDNQLSPSLRPLPRSPSPLDDQKKSISALSLSNTDVSLSSRYDFGASLRCPNWTPPQVHAMPPTSNLTTPRSRNVQRRPRSSPPPSPSKSTSKFQFPRAGQHRRSLTIPLDGSPTGTPPANSPKKSPRDSADGDKGMEEPRLRQDDDTCDEDRPRHHTRGWVRDSSSFEQLAVDASPVKKTPPGMPTVIPPTPPRQGAVFHIESEESSSSSCSPSISPSTSQEPLDNVWRALRRDKDGNSISTPSFTSSSSTPTSLSPLSPRGEFPHAASEDSLTTTTARGRNITQRPPINSTPYYSLLDQFCFFTGVTPQYNQSYNASDDSRRTQSASTVEDYFSLPTSRGDTPSPLSTISASTSSSTTHICSPIPTDFTPSRRLTTSS